MTPEEQWTSAKPVALERDWASAQPESAARFAPRLGIHRGLPSLPDPSSLDPEQLGALVTDVTGSPLLGTGVRILPDIAMTIGTGGGMAVGKPVGEMIGKAVGRSLMQTVLKPSESKLMRGVGEKAIETTLEKNIGFSQGGAEKLRKMIEPFNTKLESKIAESAATVPENAFNAAINKARVRMRSAPPEESDAFEYAVRAFQNKFYPGGGDLPVQHIQNIKQAYQRSVGPANYGQLSEGQILAHKAIAEGAKDAVEKVIPEAAELNAKMGPLINALSIVEPKALMAGNVSVPSSLAFLPHSPGLAAGLEAARNPWLRSMVARGMYHGGAGIGNVTGAGIGAGIGSVTGRNIARDLVDIYMNPPNQ